MIKIIDLFTGENFDLPKDFKISIEEKNPLLSGQGSASLPINLPYTRKNVRLTGFLHRIDKSKKCVIRRDIIISAGFFIKKGVLVIISAQKDAYFSSVVLIGESNIYSKMKDVLMTEVFKNESRDDFDIISNGYTPQKIARWVDYFNKLMFNDDLDNEISIFPVTIKDGKVTIDRMSNYSITVEDIFNYINHVAVPYDYIKENGEEVTVSGKEYYDENGTSLGYGLSAKYTVLFSENGVNIVLPVGYGVSPFLKLSYVLSKIFNYFGFNVVKNESFEKLTRRVVLLNNNIDSIMMGVIYYAQLVPTCTVSCFLKSFCNKFGGEFFLDDNGKDVLFKTWEEELTIQNNTFSLDDYISSHPSIIFERPKQLKLSRNYTKLKYPPKYSSFDELKEKHPVIPTYNLGDVHVYWDPVLHTIMEGNSEQGGPDYIPIGEYAFDFYEKKEECEVLEKKSEETFVEMILSDMSSYLKKSHSVHILCVMPYIPSVRTLNTYIKIGDTVKKNDDGGCPIMFCYRAGRYNVSGDTTLTGDNKLVYGTTYSYKADTIDLNYFRDKGLYMSNWKKFDMMLQNSFHEIKVHLHLPVEKIQKLLSFKSVNLKGQPLLTESVKYEITNENIKIVEAKFRTIKSYE